MTRHTKENFARYLGSGQIIPAYLAGKAGRRRRDLSVRVAHTAVGRTRQDTSGQAPRGQTRQSSATPDPATIAESGSTRLTEIKRRFEICKSCEHSRDNAFACKLYHGCCFGKFRSNQASQCPIGKWEKSSLDQPAG